VNRSAATTKPGRGGSSPTKVVTASLIGTAMEWYDFFLFGTMTAIALAPLFFPDVNPTTSLISAFLSFAAAFVARPIGAVIFGHFGDRLGRRGALIVTVLLMGLASTLIGALPTYETAGILAPILLTALRVLQGIATGGEWGGATLMAMEYVEPRRKPLMASIVQVGSPIGTLLSTGAVAAVSLLSREEFLTWGWRLPFLASILLVAVAVWIRVSIEETPEFVASAKSEGVARMPAWELITLAPGRTLTGVAAYLVGNAGFFLFTTFMISYVTLTLGLPRDVILTGLTWGAVAEIVAVLFAGWLGTRIGPIRVALIGYVLFVLCVFPIFWLVDSRNPGAIIWAMILALGVGSLAYGVIGAVLDKLFPVHLKYSGLALSGNLSAIIAGFMPVLATIVLGASGNASWGPALLALAIGITSVVGVLVTMRYVRRDAERGIESAVPVVHHDPTAEAGRA
jgi:MFS family permease